MNAAGERAQAAATFDLAALQQPAAVTAHDVLAEKQLPFAESRLQLPIGLLEHAVVWLKCNSSDYSREGRHFP